jgi:hypothetical protein
LCCGPEIGFEFGQSSCLSYGFACRFMFLLAMMD